MKIAKRLIGRKQKAVEAKKAAVARPVGNLKVAVLAKEAKVDTAAFTGPVAPKMNAAPATDGARALAGLSALKEAAVERNAEAQQAEKEHGPAESWSARLLAKHPRLAKLAAHIHLGQVREGNFERAADIAKGHERVVPNRRDVVAAMWHAVRSKAVSMAKNAIEFAKEHPGKAAVLGAGAVGIAAVAFVAAPALAAAVAGWLTPMLGAPVATLVGAGAAGSLASGTRSLVVHSAPMLLGVDPMNKKQLAGDTGMSAGFGFVGFAQAQGLTMLTGALGVAGLPLMAVNAIALIGIDVFKDYVQNAGRNKMGTASDPKHWRKTVDPKTGEVTEGIWKDALIAEAASNILRAIPGLETNFALKVGGDVAGTVWWDRIVNGGKDKDKAEPEAAAAAAVDKSSPASGNS